MSELIYFGGEVKALDEEGKVGGYLVRFSDAAKKDLVGDYFTDKTYYGARDGDGVDTLFHHAKSLPLKAGVAKSVASELEKLKDHVFAPVSTKKDAIGIWAETVLNMADEYESLVYDMVKSNKLGWSSGAVGHLVRREDDGRITRWPIGEASLTPQPCEPQNRAFSLKSLDEIQFRSFGETKGSSLSDCLSACQVCIDLCNACIEACQSCPNKDTQAHQDCIAACQACIKSCQACIDSECSMASCEACIKACGACLTACQACAKSCQICKPQCNDCAAGCQACGDACTEMIGMGKSIKGIFEQELAEVTPSTWQLQSVLSDVCADIANAAASADITGVTVDVNAKVTEAVNEYAQRLIPIIVAQVQDFVEEDSNQTFYLKSKLGELIASSNGLASGSPLEDHSESVASAVEEFAQEGNTLAEVLKTWAGRVERKQEFRASDPVKSGRTISKKTKDKLQVAHDSMKESISRQQAAVAHVYSLIQMGEQPKSLGFELAINEHLNWQTLCR